MPSEAAQPSETAGDRTLHSAVHRCRLWLVHPHLFSSPFGPIESYPALALLATLFGLAWLAHALSNRGLSNHGMALSAQLELFIVAILGAALGAKLFHVLFESRGHALSDGGVARGIYDVLKDDPWHWARLFDPGYVLYGGMLGALGAAWLLLARRRDVERLALMDHAAPAIAIAVLVGRVGCALGGCCHGTPTTLPWGIVMQAGTGAGLGPLHPTQFLESAAGGVLLLALWATRDARLHAGQRLAFTVAGYGVARFAIEFLRGDAARGTWAGLSSAQWIALGTLAAVLAFHRRASHPIATRTRQNAGAPSDT